MKTNQKPARPDPLFQPFAWGYQEAHALDPFAAERVRTSATTVRDLACGTALVLEMIERDQITAESEGYMEGEAAPRPLLSPADHGALMRLAIAALRTVEQQAVELQEMTVRNNI
jgi:hypothetical protein